MLNFGMATDPADLQARAATRARVLKQSFNREYREGYAHGSKAWQMALLPDGRGVLTDKGKQALERILLAHEGKRAPYSQGLSAALRAALGLD